MMQMKWIVPVAIVVVLLAAGGYMMMSQKKEAAPPAEMVQKMAAVKEAVIAAGTAPVSLGKSPAGHPVERISFVTQDGRHEAFALEIVEQPLDIQLGLMFRQEMHKNWGMMFKMGRPPKVVSFWMKNTFIPLDMIFIDEKGYIAHIKRNAEPKSLTPVPSEKPVIAVIELNAGVADDRKLSVGDRVVHPYFSAE